MAQLCQQFRESALSQDAERSGEISQGSNSPVFTVSLARVGGEITWLCLVVIVSVALEEETSREALSLSWLTAVNAS